MTQVQISPEDAEEYTQALGQVLSGGWRQRALAWRLGVPQALGMNLEQWTEHRLGGYVRMSIPERREAAAELVEEGLSQREIAGVLGVDAATVNRDLKPEPVANATPEPDPPEPEAPAPVAFATGDRDADLEDVPLWPAPESLAPRVEVNEGDEWYTPRWLFDALGVAFSLDVCAPTDLSHVTTPADVFLTVEDDGLSVSWAGTVWCNPPYSKPEPWARRMIHHRDGLLLTHMPMNAGWCVDVWDACDAIRLFQAMEFVRPDGSVQRPGYWLQLAAFGPVATAGLARLQPLGDAAANKRRIASPMWRAA